LAAMDGDRARAAGFSKTDTEFGCELAAKPSLTPRQAAVGARLARKYRRQYPVELYERIFGSFSRTRMSALWSKADIANRDCDVC
jgi:hypothetical protein